MVGFPLWSFPWLIGASQVAQTKESACNAGDLALGREDPLEKGMARVVLPFAADQKRSECAEE